MSEAVHERIRKLIAHAESARTIGNIAEAQAFAAKVQKMLLDHKLTMSDVETAEQPVAHQVGEPSRVYKRAQVWSTHLGSAVARSCFCRVIEMTGTSRLIFVGREQDRLIAISMWRFLIDIAIGFAAKDGPILKRLRPKMPPVKIRASFLMGFAAAIHARLASERAAEITATGNAAIVLVQKEGAALQLYIDESFKTQHKKSKPIRQSLAFNAGFARGMSAPLREQRALPEEAMHG